MEDVAERMVFAPAGGAKDDDAGFVVAIGETADQPERLAKIVGVLFGVKVEPVAQR